MNSERLGKILVSVNLALSLLFLAWATATYVQAIDWGWKEPRKNLLNEREPSELDKRKVLVTKQNYERKRAEEAWKESRERLSVEEQQFWQNRLFYNERLSMLDKGIPGKDRFPVTEPRYDKGVLVVNPAGAKTGRPTLDSLVPGVEKSYVAYQREWEDLHKSLDKLNQEVDKLIAREKDLSIKLIGQKDDDGKMVRKGLYELLELETKIQTEVGNELEYLRPLWMRELVDSDRLVRRRERLQARVDELLRYKASLAPR